MNTMFSLGMGGGLLLFSIGIGSHYQEEILEKKDGAKLWLLTLAMGAALLFSGGGNTLFLLLQLFLGFTVGSCCLLQLHRERYRKECQMEKEEAAVFIAEENSPCAEEPPAVPEQKSGVA